MPADTAIKRCFSLRAGAVVCLLLGLAAPVRAAYTIALFSNGEDSVAIQRGDSFDLEIWLSSNTSQENNSVIVRVAFSAAGLIYEGLEWEVPYTADHDDSTPAIAGLPMSEALTESTVSGPGYPAGVVDLEISNVILADTFHSGKLATLSLSVPSDYTGPDVVCIGVVPDTIADGFDIMDTTACDELFTACPDSVSATGLLTFQLLVDCSGPSKGDYDCDGDIDVLDFAPFPACQSALCASQQCVPALYDVDPPLPGSCPIFPSRCSLMDFDNDGDVDFRDWGDFQLAFNGGESAP